MNLWECGHSGCKCTAVGTGGAVGLRAVWWYFEMGPQLFCPDHHPHISKKCVYERKCRVCRTRSCINPEHLAIVTAAENTLRGIAPSAECARRTHCKNGHPLSGDNLMFKKSGVRLCKACKQEWSRQLEKRRQLYGRKDRIRKAS